jgi:hypothetical protein
MVEFSARMKRAKDDLQRAFLGFLVQFDGNAPAIVLDRAASVGVYLDADFVAETGERLVYRVIQNLVNEVMQAAHAAVTNVHIWAFANRFKPA